MTSCRFCGHPLKHTLVDLGLSPLANAYVRTDQADLPDRFYPLHTMVCEQCKLMQVLDYEKPEVIFSDYLYFSSFSDQWLKQCCHYAETMIERFGLNSESLVIEVASNDGYLLQFFKEKGIRVLGVEPSDKVAEVAISKGVPTDIAFFGRDTARRLRDQGIQADHMAANNVVAHVPDINDFIGGFQILLKADAVATFEFSHSMNLILENQFDFIYHEHFSYLTLGFAQRLFAASGLRVFDVEKLPTHGGSLRLFVCHENARHAQTAAVDQVLELEKAAGLDRMETYQGFTQRVEAIREQSMNYLQKAKAEGRKVGAYGAAAKGNTFLNYLKLTADHGLICCVADRNVHKQGRLMPGSRLPIVSPEELVVQLPDEVILLAWNMADEIMQQLRSLGYQGRFVQFLPSFLIH
ncbi:MAG: class I SAM-dependent methyltransferase [Planctomycetota bacterium]